MEKCKIAKRVILTAALVSGIGFVNSIIDAQAQYTDGKCVLITSNWTCPATNLSNCQCF